MMIDYKKCCQATAPINSYAYSTCFLTDRIVSSSSSWESWLAVIEFSTPRFIYAIQPSLWTCLFDNIVLKYSHPGFLQYLKDCGWCYWWDLLPDYNLRQWCGADMTSTNTGYYLDVYNEEMTWNLARWVQVYKFCIRHWSTHSTDTYITWCSETHEHFFLRLKSVTDPDSVMVPFICVCVFFFVSLSEIPEIILRLECRHYFYSEPCRDRCWHKRKGRMDTKQPSLFDLNHVEENVFWHVQDSVNGPVAEQWHASYKLQATSPHFTVQTAWRQSY